MRRFDEDRRGYISHQKFLHLIGVEFAPGDDQGISRDIVEGSMKNIEEHHMNMNYKHELQTYNQASAAWNMSVDTVMTQLR